MITDFLTQEERERGSRLMLGHALFNGLGYGFLAETIIYLLALQFNPTNTQLGFISSAVHIAGLVVLILPRLSNEINLRKMFFASWMFRGAASLFYFAVLFTRGQTAVSIILAVYAVFCIFRIVGASMAEPVQQMLATSETRGRFVAQLFLSNQSARLVSQLLSYGLTSFAYFNNLNGLLILIGLGILANTVSALFLQKIPFREKSHYQKGNSLIKVFARAVKNREQIIVILIRCFSLSAAVLIGFAVPFLRVVAGYPQNMVFLFSVVGTFGMMVSGLFLRPIMDSVGSKPLLVTAFIGQSITFLFWAILDSSPLGIFLLLGFFTTFLQAATYQLVARLVLNIIPARDKISFMSLLNFLTAFFAFITGILGGLLIDLNERVSLPFGSSYSFTFIAGAVYCGLALVLVLFVRDYGSMGMRETANIIFSPRNFKTFLDIYNFHLTDNPVKRQTILTAINYAPTPHAEPQLRQILNNPIAPEKEQILISLYTNPRPGLLPLIIREAENRESPQQISAIFALGAYPAAESVETLQRLFNLQDARISAAAAKSLARTGNPPDPEKLENTILIAGHPTRAVLDLMISLSVAGERQRYLKHLFQIIPPARGAYHQQSILSLASALDGYNPRLDWIYSRENDVPGTGMRLILEEARSFQPFLNATENLKQIFQESRHSEVSGWCCSVLVASGLMDLTESVSLTAVSAEEQTLSTSLARIYFTFQILNSRRESYEQIQ